MLQFPRSRWRADVVGHDETRCVFRSDNLDHLSPSGWRTVTQNLSVSTVVDLRDPIERADIERPAEIRFVTIPYDGPRDAPFWARWVSTRDGLGCPIFYADQLATYPELSKEVLSTLATAGGPVVIHCAAGRDRTGLVTFILLRLVGVSLVEILRDYKMSEVRLRGMYERDGLEPQAERIARFLETKATSIDQLFEETLPHVDEFIENLEPNIRVRIREKFGT